MMIKNKRGVSEVVSYVLLILVAVTISTLLFYFLNLYVPKEKPECKNGINIIITDLNCTYTSANNNDLTLTLQNTGLFKIDRAYVRIAKPGSKFRANVPKTNPIKLINIANSNGLMPGDSTPKILFSLDHLSSDYNVKSNYLIEVQPAHFTKGEDIESLALCQSITQEITCE